ECRSGHSELFIKRDTLSNTLELVESIFHPRAIIAVVLITNSDDAAVICVGRIFGQQRFSQGECLCVVFQRAFRVTTEKQGIPHLLVYHGKAATKYALFRITLE